MFDTAYSKLLDVLRESDVGILVEDDYVGFKNFFAKWKEPQLEGTCTTIEFVLMDASAMSDSFQSIEFYCHFYTTKNRQKQKLLSNDEFCLLKNFLDIQFFTPGNLMVTEYFNAKRDYRANRMRPLFMNNEPGVIIVIGGLLTYKKENGGTDAVSTR